MHMHIYTTSDHICGGPRLRLRESWLAVCCTAAASAPPTKTRRTRTLLAVCPGAVATGPGCRWQSPAGRGDVSRWPSCTYATSAPAGRAAFRQARCGRLPVTSFGMGLFATNRRPPSPSPCAVPLPVLQMAIMLSCQVSGATTRTVTSTARANSHLVWITCVCAFTEGPDRMQWMPAAAPACRPPELARALPLMRAGDGRRIVAVGFSWRATWNRHGNCPAAAIRLARRRPGPRPKKGATTFFRCLQAGQPPGAGLL